MNSIDRVKASKRKAKAQRDNWKRRAEAYKGALLTIQGMGKCCGKCTLTLAWCPVGVARAALIKGAEVGK